ncbi:MAG: hypothetical protein KDD06_16360 [Phaeodactylibacter sp.]|nr:hypothetical protein [Phaeodactylibacter sp.]MCB9264347.1 hypothetical protein [Lewinellaceae bacterium]MCB9286064.1 hypothetical protein [Lewinellaceae bacterium]
MQRDYIEQFILDNRESFDSSVPGLKAWGEISHELDRRQSRRMTFWKVSRAAAAVVLLLACGAILGVYLSGSQMQQAAQLEEIAPEYAEAEEYYKSQIDQKYQQLAAYHRDDFVEKDLARLDKVMQELREELLVAPKGKEEEIVKNLIQSYQAKVAILERVLDRLQEANPEMVKPAENEETSI